MCIYDTQPAQPPFYMKNKNIKHLIRLSQHRYIYIVGERGNENIPYTIYNIIYYNKTLYRYYDIDSTNIYIYIYIYILYYIIHYTSIYYTLHMCIFDTQPAQPPFYMINKHIKTMVRLSQHCYISWETERKRTYIIYYI